ncbi:hypothetical protein C4J97_3056 [Pseudomonas orientalis]|nr:hypothetical protein C4J97_3056 [Pseudomonas orientalis]
MGASPLPHLSVFQHWDGWHLLEVAKTRVDRFIECMKPSA